MFSVWFCFCFSVCCVCFVFFCFFFVFFWGGGRCCCFQTNRINLARYVKHGCQNDFIIMDWIIAEWVMCQSVEIRNSYIDFNLILARFLPCDPIGIRSALVQVMNQFTDALGLEELINSSPSSAAYMRQRIGSALVQIMACRLFGAKLLTKPMPGYCQFDPWGQISVTEWRPFRPGEAELNPIVIFNIKHTRSVDMGPVNNQ